MADSGEGSNIPVPDTRFQEYMSRIEELTKPKPNDKRLDFYVRCLNSFLEEMGKERIYLVGSTGEKSKLRWTTDGGDADYIMVSGSLTIPVENLQHREEMPVYVWVRGTNLDPQLCGQLVDNEYLSPEILRSVNPRLFTTLRAIYTIVTSTRHSSRGHNGIITNTSFQTKVGLGRNRYRNLQIDGGCDQFSGMEQNTVGAAYLQNRWSSTVVNPADMKMLKRILNALIQYSNEPVVKAKREGHFLYFSGLFEEVIARTPTSGKSSSQHELSTQTECTLDQGQQMADIPDETMADTGEDEVESVRATYDDKTSEDYVPALRVVGTLPCMLTFLERVKGSQWPAADIVAEIYKADVFVVSRKAPINSVVEKDCCLSFNLAEIKLSQNLPTVAKKVFLIMKSYLKGALKKMFKMNGRGLKLKTYHMKMTMFWACESLSLEIWNETNIIQAIQTVLDFFLARLDDRCLRHYFVLSNLFVGFEDEDYFLLRECIEDIKKDPVGSIEHFFDMDKQVLGEVSLTPAEATVIASRMQEGNSEPHRQFDSQKMEDAFIDLIRGLNASSKDEHGNAPIKVALMKAVNIMFEEDRKKRQPTEDSSPNTGTRRSNTAQAIAGLMNAFVTGGGSQSHRSREATQRLDLLAGIGSLFPEGRSFLSNVGGTSGLQNILEATADPAADHTVELKGTIEKFLSCDDSMVDELLPDLKQKLIAYYIGKAS